MRDVAPVLVVVVLVRLDRKSFSGSEMVDLMACSKFAAAQLEPGPAKRIEKGAQSADCAGDQPGAGACECQQGAYPGEAQLAYPGF